MEDPSELIALIEWNGIQEVVKITVLQGFLGNARVEITMADAGDKAGSSRFSLSARVLEETEALPDFRKEVLSWNPAATPMEAVSNAHWNELRRRANPGSV